MEIMVNGQPLALAPGSTVADIAEARGLVGKGGVAIAVNGAVVRQADWPSRRLEEGDKVVILTAAQGSGNGRVGGEERRNGQRVFACRRRAFYA